MAVLFLVASASKQSRGSMSRLRADGSRINPAGFVLDTAVLRGGLSGEFVVGLSNLVGPALCAAARAWLIHSFFSGCGADTEMPPGPRIGLWRGLSSLGLSPGVAERCKKCAGYLQGCDRAATAPWRLPEAKSVHTHASSLHLWPSRPLRSTRCARQFPSFRKP
jgi:hypothetical protein